MTDQPYHHTPDHYLWLAQHTEATDQTPQQVWGHDHDGAYRQLPLDDPSLAYVLLLTPEGPTLWLHHVLLFWQCCERLVVQQVRRCPYIPVKSANSNTGGTLSWMTMGAYNQLHML